MAKMIKPLTNTQVSQAKPSGKPQNLTDGGGLYLHISKAGTKAWRIDFTTPVTKKRVTMTELCWRNRTTKLGKLSTIIGVYHDQEIKNLQ